MLSSWQAVELWVKILTVRNLSIQNNVTSQEEIFDRLGAPFKKGIENGQVMWTYQFDQWNAVGPTHSKDLVILFDKENIVKAYRYTTSNP